MIECCCLVCGQKIISSLMHVENDSSDVIVRFQEYMEYDDLRYYTMKSMLELLKSHSDVSSFAQNKMIIFSHVKQLKYIFNCSLMF